MEIQTFSSVDVPAPVHGRTTLRRIWEFPITRIVVYLLVLLAIGIVFTILAGIVVAIASLSSGGLHGGHAHPLTNATAASPADTSPASSPLMYASEALSALAAFGAGVFMALVVDRRPWPTYGFPREGMLRDLGKGFCIGGAAMAAGIAVSAVLGIYHASTFRPSLILLLPMLLYFSVGFFEETLFRGYIFQTLEHRWGSGVALVVTSIGFGLIHLTNPTPGATPLQHWLGPLYTCFEAGLPLAAAYLLTRKLWLSIGLHFAWDYFEGPIFGCPDSGTHDPHSLVQAHFTGPWFLSGGPFGPEAGVVFLLCGTALGVFLLRAAIQRGNWIPLRNNKAPYGPAPVPEPVSPYRYYDNPIAGLYPAEEAESPQTEEATPVPAAAEPQRNPWDPF